MILALTFLEFLDKHAAGARELAGAVLLCVTVIAGLYILFGGE